MVWLVDRGWCLQEPLGRRTPVPLPLLLLLLLPLGHLNLMWPGWPQPWQTGGLPLVVSAAGTATRGVLVSCPEELDEAQDRGVWRQPVGDDGHTVVGHLAEVHLDLGENLFLGEVDAVLSQAPGVAL